MKSEWIDWEGSFRNAMAYNTALREAVQPLADLRMRWTEGKPDSLILFQLGDGDHTATITVGDVRRAGAALQA